MPDKEEPKKDSGFVDLLKRIWAAMVSFFRHMFVSRGAKKMELDIEGERPKKGEHSGLLKAFALVIGFIIGGIWAYWSIENYYRANRNADTALEWKKMHESGQGQVTELQGQIDKAKKDVLTVNDMLTEAKAKAEQLQADLAKAQDESKAAKEALAKSEAEKEKVTIELIKAKSDLSSMRSEPKFIMTGKSAVLALSVKSILPEELKYSIVDDGGSVNRSLMRELFHNPSLADGTRFSFKGNRKSHDELYRWASRTANLISKKAGFESGGREVRVKVAGKVAYNLEKDASGNLGVQEYQLGSDGQFHSSGSFKPLNQTNAFAGDSGLQAYEYISSSGGK